MGSAYSLTGQCILVVEDEPLIAIEMAALFESAGAKVVAARSVAEAMRLAEHARPCGAVLDYRLGNDSVPTLCRYLADCHIPFMFYTGYADLQGTYPNAVVVQKPANGDALIAAMSDLVAASRVEQAST